MLIKKKKTICLFTFNVVASPFEPFHCLLPSFKKTAFWNEAGLNLVLKWSLTGRPLVILGKINNTTLN